MARLPALPFIRAGLSEGFTQTETLQQYRDAAQEAGLTGMRTYDFQRLFNDESRARGAAAEAMAAPKDIPGGGLRPEPWETTTEPGYIHWAPYYQVERDSGALIRSVLAIKSTELLTPEEVEQRASAFLDSQPDNYNRRTIAVTFGGVRQLIPRGDVYPD